MYISNLSYLEELFDVADTISGSKSCSLSVSSINGKMSVKSNGCRVTKTVIKKGPITTTTYKAGNSTVTISSSGKRATSTSVVSSNKSFPWKPLDIWDNW